MMRVLLSGFLIALMLSGQDSFQAVKQALALSDAQITQIQQVRPHWPDEAVRLRAAILDDAQRAKLASIRKVLYGDTAHLAARLGLINRQDWEQRFGQTCLFGEIRQYIYYTKRYSAKPLELYLSPAQAERFERIQREREALLNAGSTKDTHAPLPRDVVMSILDSIQKAKLAEFESELQVAAEAVQLGLIESAGEVLCH